MRKILSLSLLLTAALLIGVACQKASTAQMTANNSNQALPQNVALQTEDAPRINLEDAKKDFDAGTAIFVDTRGESAYKNEHIKGSINITADMLEAKYKNLPKDKKIIAYCS